MKISSHLHEGFFNLGRSFVARQIWFGSIIFDPKDVGGPDPTPHAAVQVERIFRRIVDSQSGNSGTALTKVSAGTLKSRGPGFFASNYRKKLVCHQYRESQLFNQSFLNSLIFTDVIAVYTFELWSNFDNEVDSFLIEQKL